MKFKTRNAILVFSNRCITCERAPIVLERHTEAAGATRRAAESDEERTRLLARTYQWLTRSQRRRLQVLDARAVLVRYPWLARAEAARRALRPPTPQPPRGASTRVER